MPANILKTNDPGLLPNGLRVTVSNVYLAARLRRRDDLNAFREQLEAAGVEVTSRWLTAEPPSELNEEVWQGLAELDREDILSAETLVLFSEPEHDGGSGRHVEFGMALALGKRVVVVGEIENLFQRLPEVTVVPDWEAALALMTEA